LLAGIFWFTVDLKAAYSVMIAGLICIISNSYFTWRVFRHQGARAAKQFVKAFCFGEVVKLFIQGLLFVVAICFLPIAIGPFLLGFIVNLMIFWLAPFIQFAFIDRR